MLRWLLVADGGSIHTRRLASALAALGHDVHLACHGAPPLEEVTVHALGGGPGDLKFIAGVPALRGLIRRLRPNVVNAHYLSSYGLMTALTGRRGVVQTVWGTDLLVTAQRGWRREAARRVLGRAGLVTGCSRSLLDASEELAPQVPVHHFLFGPPAWLFSAPRPPSSGMVLSPRRHAANYRIDLVLAAWEVMRPRMPEGRLVVAGTGPLSGRLRAEAGPAVEFTGQLSYDEVLRLSLGADLVISVPRSDAAGQSVLEAMAARSSVVASDVAAMREWLPEERLVPQSTTPEQVAAAALRLSGKGLSLDPRWSIERQVPLLVEAVQKNGNV